MMPRDASYLFLITANWQDNGLRLVGPEKCLGLLETFRFYEAEKVKEKVISEKGNLLFLSHRMLEIKRTPLDFSAEHTV